MALSASATAKRSLAGLAVVGATAVGLVMTNPGPGEFQAFAGETLTQLLSEELCRDDGLPMMARIVIRDCPALVASQRGVLGRLAAHHTRRRNFGLLSTYHTALGGQQVLPGWRLPRYTATTLGAAGRFLLLEAREEPPPDEGNQADGGNSGEGDGR